MLSLNTTIPFKLHSNCILVYGYQRYCIIDLQNNKLFFITNSLADFLRKYEGNSINRISLNFQNSESIIQYFEYLILNDLIFFTDDLDCFPKLELLHKSASIISNVILEYGNNINYKQIAKFLDDFNCKGVAIFFSNQVQLSNILNILDCFKLTRVEHIEFYINTIIDKNLLIELFLKESRLQKIVITNCTKDEIFPIKNGFGREILYTTTDININNRKTKRIFRINLRTVSEGISYHTYFNQKLFITSKGIIKNAPECMDEYGNIQKIKNSNELKTIVDSPDFTKYWHIKKDKCDICLDCEYRYICIDNRVPFRQENEIWYYENSCTYNPYISLWEGQEGYITVEEWRRQNPNWEKGLKRYPLVKNPQNVE